MKKDYSSIINMEHYRSKKRSPMSMSDRAAQFASFAALTDHNDAIAESERYTDTEKELSDYEKELLSRKIKILKEHIKERPYITVTCFVKDESKPGGRYADYTGRLRVIDELNSEFIFTCGKRIDANKVSDINAEIIDEVTENANKDTFSDK